jgi:hypothetical protein
MARSISAPLDSRITAQIPFPTRCVDPQSIYAIEFQGVKLKCGGSHSDRGAAAKTEV